MTLLPTIKVTSKELQGKFNVNEGGYPSKIDELARECIYDRPASPKSNQPPGTRSRLYKYSDGTLPVMYLHSFVLPSGELGASGKMDPKRLLVGGVYYYYD
jgi:hypothetical protein